METSSRVQKNRLLKMILKSRKKRKIRRVESKLTVGGISTSLYETELGSTSYNLVSGKVRESLKEIVRGN